MNIIFSELKSAYNKIRQEIKRLNSPTHKTEINEKIIKKIYDEEHPNFDLIILKTIWNLTN